MMKAWILAGALVQNDIPPLPSTINDPIFNPQVLTQEIETSLNEQMARLIEETQQTLLDIEPTSATLANQATQMQSNME